MFSGDDSTKQFVAADLILTAGEGYPERPPHICLREVKGALSTEPFTPCRKDVIRQGRPLMIFTQALETAGLRSCWSVCIRMLQRAPGA